MTVRAIRGATRLGRDDPGEMADAVRELVREIIERNQLRTDNLISVLFTATPDLVSAFPATAARSLGLADVPLLCAQELAVEGALERVVRVMVTAECDRPRKHIVHVYLRGAEVLREDLAD